MARLSPKENNKESPPWVTGRVKDRDRFAVLAKAIPEIPDSRQKKRRRSTSYSLLVVGMLVSGSWVRKVWKGG